jgi:hypothetical protein
MTVKELLDRHVYCLQKQETLTIIDAWVTENFLPNDLDPHPVKLIVLANGVTVPTTVIEEVLAEIKTLLTDKIAEEINTLEGKEVT